MAIRYDGKTAHLEQHCIVDEAQAFVEFISSTPGARVDLSCCDSLHTSVLQVIAASRNCEIVPPSSERLQQFIMPFIVAGSTGATVGKGKS